ncbi:MAG TPA: hypothetical protein VH087_12495 [Thermoanaerobaculia bacterium]|jgi:hypothetical protein|nr:hypothetical protein [Thermoanaerobaculia bacterium]
MFTMMAFFGVLMIGATILAALVMLAIAAKVALKVVLLPIKLLLLPIFAIVLIVKLAVLLAVGAVIFAVLIPIAVVGAICAAPFVLAAMALG